jgi:hypothetical protein
MGQAEIPPADRLLQEGDAVWLAVADDALAGLDALLSPTGGA